MWSSLHLFSPLLATEVACTSASPASKFFHDSLPSHRLFLRKAFPDHLFHKLLAVPQYPLFPFSKEMEPPIFSWVRNWPVSLKLVMATWPSSIQCNINRNIMWQYPRTSLKKSLVHAFSFFSPFIHSAGWNMNWWLELEQPPQTMR